MAKVQLNKHLNDFVAFIRSVLHVSDDSILMQWIAYLYCGGIIAQFKRIEFNPFIK